MNRALLEKPFEPNQVKQRQGNFGHILDYVEGHAIIARLNDAFEGNWSFELINHWILKETDEVLVLGKLTAEEATKMAFGSKAIARNKETETILSLGDDLKAASTDALKKAASLFGVGLYLYSDSKATEKEERPTKTLDSENPKPDIGHQTDGKGNNGGRLTNRQLADILSIGKSKGLQNKDIKERAINSFKKNLHFLTKEEALAFTKMLQSIEVKPPEGEESWT
jgi:hypothetical protein